MSKAKPLTAEQCEAAREAMLTGHSLSKISRCAGVVATIEYMLKDIRLLETYLQRMASAITQKREQISHSALLLSMFHYCRICSARTERERGDFRAGAPQL